MSKIRVVVVDDSPTMRGLITARLRLDSDIDVVGTACDPIEARNVIKAQNPDVITLDIEMPQMDGLSFLEKIMRLRPTPVIMISTLTEKGAAISVEALQLGAFDCVCKPTGAPGEIGFTELPGLVKAAALSKPRALNSAPQKREAISSKFSPNSNLVAIGSSTGGVEALVDVLGRFPENCPPTVITQHMPKSFTSSFANRLDRICAPTVREAEDGAPLVAGNIYLAPGGEQHLKVTNKPVLSCSLVDGGRVSGHCPSVDVLFDSVAEIYGRKAVGVILTGMGRDGAKGLLNLKNMGARTIGQDEHSSVVFGMPRAAYELGGVERQLPLAQIANTVLRLCDKTQQTKAA